MVAASPFNHLLGSQDSPWCLLGDKESSGNFRLVKFKQLVEWACQGAHSLQGHVFYESKMFPLLELFWDGLSLDLNVPPNCQLPILQIRPAPGGHFFLSNPVLLIFAKHPPQRQGTDSGEPWEERHPGELVPTECVLASCPGFVPLSDVLENLLVTSLRKTRRNTHVPLLFLVTSFYFLIIKRVTNTWADLCKTQTFKQCNKLQCRQTKMRISNSSVYFLWVFFAWIYPYSVTQFGSWL